MLIQTVRMSVFYSTSNFATITTEGEPELAMTTEELVSLLTTVVVQAQCSQLVANIYYMTHFIFSVTEDDPLWYEK